MNKAVSLLISAALILCLSGCGETVPLREKLIIEGIAIDVDEQDYAVTVQAYSPAKDNAPGYQLFRGKGKTVYEALRNIDENVGKQSYFSDTRVIVFSLDSLKKGLWSNLDFFIRSSDIGSNVCVAATKGKAEKLFSIESESNNLPARVLSNVLHYGRSESHQISGELMDIGARMVQPESDVSMHLIAAEKKDGKQYPNLGGVLCFRGEKPCTVINEHLEWAYHWLRDFQDERAYGITFDGHPVSLDIKSAAPNVTAQIENGHPHFSVMLQMACDIAEVSSAEAVSVSRLEDFKQCVAADVCSVMEQAVDQILVQNRCDVFNFGRILKKQQPAYFKTLSSWREEMPDCTFSFGAEVTVTRAGQGVVSR